MDPNLRHLIASVLIHPSAFDVTNCHNELLLALGSKNYVNAICFAFFEERGPIDIGAVVDVLNITPIQAAIVYLALVKGSQSKDQRQMALLLLARKLGEIGTSIVGKDFNSVSSNSLSQSRIGKVGIKNDPVIPESTMLDLIMWASSAQDIGEVHLFLSANALMSMQEEARAAAGKGSPGNTEQQSPPTQFSIMAAVLSEIGGICSVTQDVFVAILKHICTSQRMHFNEEWIARLLVEAVSVWTKPEAANGFWPKSTQAVKLLKSFHAAADEATKKVFDFQAVMQNPAPDKPALNAQWNIDTVLAAIKQCVKLLVPRGQEIKWMRVAELLDDSRLRLLSNKTCEILTRMFYRLSDINFPTSTLALKLWSNTTAQFAMVAWISALSSSNTVHVDLGPFIRNCCERIVGANDTVFQTLWPSMTLYRTLLSISGRSPNLFAKVLQLILSKSKLYPEYIVVCLASLTDPADVASNLRSEVLYQILPYFTGLEGSLPTSATIWNVFASKNVELLELLFRLTIKHAQTSQEIIDATTKLKSVNETVFQKVEKSNGHTGALDDLLSYWCVKADKQPFNLEKFIAATLQENPKAASGVFVYIQNRLGKLRLRSTFEGGVLSFESCAALLQALQQHIPMDKLRRIMHVLQQGFQSAQQAAKEGRSPMVASVSGAGAPTISMPTTAASGPSGQGSPNRMPDLSPSQSGFAANPISSANPPSLMQIPPTPPAPVVGGAGLGPPIQSSAASADEFDAFVKRGPSAEVSGAANQYFQQIYKGSLAVPDVLKVLQRLRDSENRTERDIFMCMILNLFDEYRFFPKYPKKDLQISGMLFGHLIGSSLLTSRSLAVALKFVLDALSKDPLAPADATGATNEAMFQFGIIALGCFRAKLPAHQQFCNELVRVSPFQRECPDLFAEVQRAIGLPVNAPVNAALAGGFSSGAMGGISSTSPRSVSAQSLALQASQNTISTVPLQRSLSDGSGTLNLKGIPSVTENNAVNRASDTNFISKYNKLIDDMIRVNVDNYSRSPPSESVRDKIHFIFNNISAQTSEARSLELAQMLTQDHLPWFGSYIIEKRVSAQPNFHGLYISIINNIGSPALDKQILNSTYYNITRLLQSPTITTSSTERSVLRNLGMWLGQMTLARNKPILQRRINLKELLFWGYETGRLIAVCSFVAKIVEGVRDSTIFRPPNPWLTALLGVLRDLYETEDLKMNIKFEVQVLCKSVNIRIEDIPRAGVLRSLTIPVKDGKNPDFNITTRGGPGSSPPVVAQASQNSPPPMTNLPVGALEVSQADGIAFNNKLGNVNMRDANMTTNLTERTVIPNLAAYVTINPLLLSIGPVATFRRLFCQALDRAIVEVIQNAVEKSVGIVCSTTKYILLKDFARDSSEKALRHAAHITVMGLASRLVVVSCREPLRMGIANHLRALLFPRISNEEAVEKIVKICTVDNVELACALVEKATQEKATQVIDEKLANAYLARQRYNAETDGPFFDTTQATEEQGKYPKDLPAMLKPAPTGLTSSQHALYDGFVTNLAPPLSSGSESDELQPAPPSVTDDVNFSTSQSVDGCMAYIINLEHAIQKTLMQGMAAGTVISLSMLPGDSEIVMILRELAAAIQRTANSVRPETALAMVESVLKRLFDNSIKPSILRLEALVGALEVLRDTSGVATKVVPSIGSWLASQPMMPVEDELVRKTHRSRLLLLRRSNLLLAHDLDVHFTQNMDSGRSLIWVETALGVVRQCLVDGMATAQDFAGTFDAVSRMRPPNAAVRKQLQKWLHDLQTLVASREAATFDPSKSNPAAYNANAGTNVSGNNLAANSLSAGPVKVDAAVREHITVLLERWLRVWKSANDQVFAQYLQLMHQYGVLKTENSANRFFRTATELCVEACCKSARPSNDGTTILTYTVMDALSKLFLYLLLLADREAADVMVRVNLLNRILTAVARTLIDDHEEKKINRKVFDQRPYVRLLSGLMQDLGQLDPKTREPNHTAVPLLTVYYQLFMLLNPATVPGFAFAWLQLVSSKNFMPQLLQIKQAKEEKGWAYMHRLLLSLFVFLQQFLKNSQLTDAIRRLYKGTLRVLLVLVHDFPEFLCYYQMSFCDVIPATCVQLRNLILSAFPRTMRLPDPFTPNLRVDALPEIRQAPSMLENPTLYNSLNRTLRMSLDTYLASKQPEDFPSILPQMLVMSSATGGSEYNVPLINLVTMYIGEKGVERLQAAQVSSEQVEQVIKDSPSWNVYNGLISGLDAEGRYHLFNAMANQLRYPNSCTYYFSALTLSLFAEASSEFIQEQITRVLLERLIVHRPHPWGLLVTFIELIKSPRYSFWKRGFTKFAPEIEKVFDSVARLCLGAKGDTTGQEGTGAITTGNATPPTQQQHPPSQQPPNRKH